MSFLMAEGPQLPVSPFASLGLKSDMYGVPRRTGLISTCEALSPHFAVAAQHLVFPQFLPFR